MSSNDILQEYANQIITTSRKHGQSTLKLLGGLAIRRLFPEASELSVLKRSCKDIDFAVGKHDAKGLNNVFEELGFLPNRQFNALHGATRLLYSLGEIQADIFIGVFEQCHRLDLESRLRVLDDTLTPADLLLMKLQVVEINEKDYQDLCILLLGCDLGSQDSIATINMDYLTRITSQDWGWYTTCCDTLEKLIPYIRENFSSGEDDAIINKIKQIVTQMEQRPKSLKWKMRGAVGRKIQWYELPEETRRSQ
jgi:hypothetical protein